MKVRRLPSSRQSKRYVVFRVHSSRELGYEQVKNAIWNSLLSWLGEEDIARANLKLVKNLWDSRTKRGFLQCSPKSVDRVKVSLSLIHQIGDNRVTFQTLRVSGTIKSAKSKTA